MQWVKDLALSLLWLRFDPWPWNFRMPHAWPKKERRKGGRKVREKEERERRKERKSREEKEGGGGEGDRQPLLHGRLTARPPRDRDASVWPSGDGF